MAITRRLFVTSLAIALLCGLLYLTDSRAFLDGHISIQVVLKSGSDKEVRTANYLIEQTLPGASLALDDITETRWRSVSPSGTGALRILCAVPFERYTRGPFGVGLTTYYANYSGLALKVQFADGSKQSLAVPIPDLRYEATPFELVVEID